MLFNSYTFLVLFLPLTLVVFQLLRRGNQRVAMGWLVLMSLLYYGWWNPDPSKPWTPFYLILICTSCMINFWIGRFLAAHTFTAKGRLILGLGLTANLGVLFYYKYIGLFERTMEALTLGKFSIPDVVLPLGLSFFTFQKIAFLVDAYRGKTSKYNFLDFLLFVTFFPQLIAGPIVHHNEIMPQIQRTVSPSRRSVDLSVGISLFAIGLFKKVVIADNLASVANPLFGAVAAAGGRDLTIMEAWAAAISYSLQLYFDFSGYSDMAIGAARMFGIKLPVNFHSPYKATSIVDFWRRWHITLSRFLRDYVYFSLGGNRKGPFLRYANLLITMLLGGLWHGAGWTYILWGGMHGLFLCVNHAWFALRKKLSIPAMPKPLAIFLTFIVVVSAWVPFRAGAFELAANGSAHEALRATKSILASMFGLNGFEGWPNAASSEVKFSWASRAILCVLIVFFFPNSQQLLRRYFPALGLRGLTNPGTRAPVSWRKADLLPPVITCVLAGVATGLVLGKASNGLIVTSLALTAFFIGRCRWQWRPTWQWTVFTTLLVIGSIYEFDKVSEFIYFQF